MLLGPTQIALEGYTSTAVEKTYSRAQNLCSQLDDGEAIIPILWNMAGFHMARAELSKSRSLIEKLDKQAEMASDTNFDLVVNAAYAQQLLFEGRISESSERCDSVLSQYNIAQHHQLAESYSQEDPGLACSSISALVHWLLGFSDQSANQMQAFDNLSKELDNPHSVAFGLVFACATQQFRKDAV